MTVPPTASLPALPRDASIPESLAEFVRRFPTERSCAKLLRRWKYGADGFRCPRCECKRAWYLPSRRLDECCGCGKQTSLTAGTLFEKSTKPLRTWFLALRAFTASKQGISATELAREIGISYPTAWTWLHKMRSLVFQRPQEPLSGVVEADETFEGGPEKRAHTGRGTLKKSVIGGAVEITKHGFGRCRLAVLSDTSGDTLGAFLREYVAAGARLRTDAWTGYTTDATAGFEHTATTIKGSGRKAHEVLPGVHRVFALLGRVLATTYQGAATKKYMSLYLAEFEFRFNRRHSKSRALLFQRALSAGVQRSPPTYWEIIGRERPKRRAA